MLLLLLDKVHIILPLHLLPFPLLAKVPHLLPFPLLDKVLIIVFNLLAIVLFIVALLLHLLPFPLLAKVLIMVALLLHLLPFPLLAKVLIIVALLLQILPFPLLAKELIMVALLLHLLPFPLLAKVLIIVSLVLNLLSSSCQSAHHCAQPSHLCQSAHLSHHSGPPPLSALQKPPAPWQTPAQTPEQYRHLPGHPTPDRMGFSIKICSCSRCWKLRSSQNIFEEKQPQLQETETLGVSAVHVSFLFSVLG